MMTIKKYKKQVSKPAEKKFRAIGWISLLFAISSLATGSYGFSELENYFQELQFSIFLSILGITSGLSFYYLVLCPLVPGLINFKDSNWSPPIGFVIGFLGISFGLAVYFNKHNSAIKYCKDFKVDRKSQSSGRYPSNYIFITINNKTERLKSSTEYWNRISEDQLINLCIIKGKLGFDYIRITDN